MKKLLILSALFLFALGLRAQTDTKADFSSVASSGQVLYYKVVGDGEVTLWYHNEYPEMLGGHVVVPRFVRHQGRNYVVTAVADNAFANCIRMQAMELPNTLYTIGDKAFYRCADLRTITMPESLESIGAQAFEGCGELLDVVMPDAVTSVGACAFKDCVKVRHFVISHQLEAIPEGCFQNCAAVTDFIIPASVKTLGKGCFDGCVRNSSVLFFGFEPPVPELEPAFPVDVPITVFRKAFDAYKASYIWGQYQIRQM